MEISQPDSRSATFLNNSFFLLESVDDCNCANAFLIKDSRVITSFCSSTFVITGSSCISTFELILLIIGWFSKTSTFLINSSFSAEIVFSIISTFSSNFVEIFFAISSAFNSIVFSISSDVGILTELNAEAKFEITNS